MEDENFMVLGSRAGAALTIGESVVTASAYFENEPRKVINASVKSAGLFDLAPFNRMLNQGTEKHFAGKIEIEQMTSSQIR